MCGIMGYVGITTDAAQVVFSGLQELEYRGYDSWGVAVATAGEFSVAKATGALPAAAPSFVPAELAIGHTRWATTGKVSYENAHPHLSTDRRLAVVHNGIVENHTQLRKEIDPTVLRSETDTELIVHLLAAACARGASLSDAVHQVGSRLSGLNAFVAAAAQTGEVVAFRAGSPLYVGVSEGNYFVASDANAMLEQTRMCHRVPDGQLVHLSANGCRASRIDNREEQPVTFVEVQWERGSTSLGAFESFVEKEIAEQPGILEVSRLRGADLRTARQLLNRAQRIVFTGCGTAYHAGVVATHLLSAFGKRAEAIYAHELLYRKGAFSPGDVVVALSQSGETIDVLEAVALAKRARVPVLAITNVPGCSLMAEADVTVLLGAGVEKSVLSTKAFTAKIALLARLTELLFDTSVETELATAVQAMRQGLDQVAQAELRHLAETLHDVPRLFLLGSGLNYPLALEGALKIKEVSYVHAEAFPAGELKHGVLALVEQGTPCFVLIPDDETADRVLIAAEEVKARGAFVVGIAAQTHPSFDVHLPVSGSGLAYFLGALVRLQLFGCALAKQKGLDPDRPRNLAKSVTVR